MNLKLKKRDVYYGYDNYGFPQRKFRLQKLKDGYYCRWISKGMFYWIFELKDNINIFNVTKLKLSKKRKYKNR